MSTRSYATLAVSGAAFREISERLAVAGYSYATFMNPEGTLGIDLHGIVLVEDEPSADPYQFDENAVLAAAIDRMGWREIDAFNTELARGQQINEDAGGFFMRAIRRLFGLPAPAERIETYQEAARRMVEEAARGRT